MKMPYRAARAMKILALPYEVYRSLVVLIAGGRLLIQVYNARYVDRNRP